MGPLAASPRGRQSSRCISIAGCMKDSKVKLRPAGPAAGRMDVKMRVRFFFPVTYQRQLNLDFSVSWFSTFYSLTVTRSLFYG